MADADGNLAIEFDGIDLSDLKTLLGRFAMPPGRFAREHGADAGRGGIGQIVDALVAEQNREKVVWTSFLNNGAIAKTEAEETMARDRARRADRLASWLEANRGRFSLETRRRKAN